MKCSVRTLFLRRVPGCTLCCGVHGQSCAEKPLPKPGICLLGRGEEVPVGMAAPLSGPSWEEMPEPQSKREEWEKWETVFDSALDSYITGRFPKNGAELLVSLPKQGGRRVPNKDPHSWGNSRTWWMKPLQLDSWVSILLSLSSAV